MNRLAIALAALAAAAVFAACNSRDKTDKKTDEAPAGDPSASKPAEPGAPAPAPVDRPAEPAATPVPAPAGAPATESGIAECDSFVKRVLACPQYPQQSKEAISQGVEAWKAARTKGGEAARQAADTCKKAEQAADQSLKGLGC